MNLKVNINIIGGCAITQKNIPKKNRYFSILKRNIEAHLPFETTFNFSTYTNFNHLEKSVLEIFDKKKADVLIIQIRPQPFINLTKLLIRSISPKVSINPLLKRKNHSSKNEIELPPEFNQLVSKPFFMGFNVFIGRLFQLNMRASIKIFEILVNIQNICNQNDTKLFVLGISPQPMTKQGNTNCRILDNYLIEKCDTIKINYIDIFEKLNDLKYFELDKIHLSELGHKKLGESLSEGTKTFYNNKYSSCRS